MTPKHPKMRAPESTSHPYTLQTPFGSLQGLEQRDRTGKPILYRFTRVPYALPPVGPLRWRRPQPLPSSFTFNTPSGTPGDYTSFGPICPQPASAPGIIALPNPANAPPIPNTQDEDCLYLNIWVPASRPLDGETRKGWPVQFHLHGGWLQVGNAMQSHDSDPFDLLAHMPPRIIVTPTYRLNVFGFLAGADLAACHEDPAPANYGFWDQRCALEWVGKHIGLFGGDASNITVGGHSAGANATFFQLHYDSLLPAPQRLIKRVYLWSNAVAIQPHTATSAVLTSQFHELCTLFSIPLSKPPHEKLRLLRAVPFHSLVAALSRMKMHSFRASTDESFIPSSFLSSFHAGTFTTRIAQQGTSILLGEVADEKKLYKLINPPSSYPDLLTQLNNYYPSNVVQATLPLYPLPPTTSTDREAWAEVSAQIVADGQVHASLRGLAHILLNPPSGRNVTPLPPRKLHRYRISWRAPALDNWVRPDVGVCHGLDGMVWWCTGYRADYSRQDKEVIKAFLEPFARFLYGEDPQPQRGERYLRHLRQDGTIGEDEEDGLWERGMQVWEATSRAQGELVDKTGKETERRGQSASKL